jgi:hypothetical protein
MIVGRIYQWKLYTIVTLFKISKKNISLHFDIFAYLHDDTDIWLVLLCGEAFNQMYCLICQVITAKFVLELWSQVNIDTSLY